MTTATYSLARATESGSYFHRITFAPAGDVVRITEVMRDELLGGWMAGNGQTRAVGIVEARAYYRDRRAAGYR